MINTSTTPTRTFYSSSDVCSCGKPRIYDVSVSCALPDLQWVAWTAIGVVIVAAAVGLWLARKMRHE